MEYETMKAEVEAIAQKVLRNQPFGGILTCEDYPDLYTMLCYEEYRGKVWAGVRKHVDYLDQVTFWRM